MNPERIEAVGHSNAVCFTCKNRIRKGEMMVDWRDEGYEHLTCSMRDGWLKGER